MEAKCSTCERVSGSPIGWLLLEGKTVCPFCQAGQSDEVTRLRAEKAELRGALEGFVSIDDAMKNGALERIPGLVKIAYAIADARTALANTAGEEG